MPKVPSWGPPAPAMMVAAIPGRGAPDEPWRRSIRSNAWLATAEPNLEATDDLAIVRAVLGGDREAFRVLVEREGAALVRACQRVLGDPHEAEDVAQEAFVIAFRSLPSWRADGPFGAWLARIGVRLAVRRAARRRSVTWIDPHAGVDLPSSPDLVDHADPAVTTLRAEQTATLRAAVAALDEPYRETLALRFFAERSLAEIATETGRPIGTVKTHLHRGLLRLRERLDAGERTR